MLTQLEIKNKLLTEDKWLYRAIYVIYERQTSREKAAGDTMEDNGIGFSGLDGKVMSFFAEKLIKNKCLSASDTRLARVRMIKYAGQLLQISKETNK